MTKYKIMNKSNRLFLVPRPFQNFTKIHPKVSVILLTGKPTNKQTNKGNKHNLLTAKVKSIYLVGFKYNDFNHNNVDSVANACITVYACYLSDATEIYSDTSSKLNL